MFFPFRDNETFYVTGCWTIIFWRQKWQRVEWTVTSQKSYSRPAAWQSDALTGLQYWHRTSMYALCCNMSTNTYNFRWFEGELFGNLKNINKIFKLIIFNENKSFISRFNMFFHHLVKVRTADMYLGITIFFILFFFYWRNFCIHIFRACGDL